MARVLTILLGLGVMIGSSTALGIEVVGVAPGANSVDAVSPESSEGSDETQVAGISVSEADPHTQITLRFEHVGSMQYLAVPLDVETLEIVACGAQGAAEGDQVRSSLEVTPNSVVAVVVGADGEPSDVRNGGHEVEHRVVVAAGGDEGSNVGGPVLRSVCNAAGWVTVSYATRTAPTIRPHGVLIVEEGDRASVIYRLPVLLTVPSPIGISVDWSIRAPVQDGEADLGIDIAPGSGTVAFAAGETQAWIEVEVYGDLEDEVPLLWGEWANIVFTDPHNAALDGDAYFGLGLVIIIDDD